MAAEARPAAPADGPARPTPAPPARLAASVWLGRLAAGAGAQSVQVALGDGDGTVRLRTRPGADVVSVDVRFSDPELQALAGAHAVRLRETLEAHFESAVRLSLADGSGSGGPGADADGSAGGRPDAPARAPSETDPASPTRPASPSPTPPPPGRREWIG